MSSGSVLMRAVMRYLVKALTAEPFNWQQEQIGRIEEGLNGPFILMDESTTRPWRSVTFDGETHKFILSLEGRKDTDAIDLRQQVEKIVPLFHDLDLPLKGHVLIDLVFDKAFTRKKRTTMDIEPAYSLPP